MSDSSNTIGNNVEVAFVAFNKTASGKVDTGATTSSLHATNINVNAKMQQVSFQSDMLSSNVVTLPLVGMQEVHSADAGGHTRPIVSLDVTINDIQIDAAAFNLNDRSNMDSKVLIGQNILQVAGVVIDPTQNDQPQGRLAADTTKEALVLSAIETLVEHNVSLADLVKYMQTAAVNRIKD